MICESRWGTTFFQFPGKLKHLWILDCFGHEMARSQEALLPTIQIRWGSRMDLSVCPAAVPVPAVRIPVQTVRSSDGSGSEHSFLIRCKIVSGVLAEYPFVSNSAQH